MSFLFLRFNWFGVSEILTGGINDWEAFENFAEATSKMYFIIFPVSMMIAAVVSSIIAHNREYLLGFISILPLFVFPGTVEKGKIWTVSLIASFLGMTAVKFVKKKRRMRVVTEEMMKHTTKNIIAVFSGILILLLSWSCMDFLFMKFNWFGIAETLEKATESGFNDMEALDNYLKAMSKTALIIFPVSMMIAAVVSSIIAHNREYLLGFISILPPLVFLGIADQKMIWLVSLIPSFLGVAAVKFVKKKRRMRVVT